MKVEVDKSLCIGCEICASECVDTFKMDDDQKAYVAQQPPADLPSQDCVLEAASSCPTNAILVQ